MQKCNRRIILFSVYSFPYFTISRFSVLITYPGNIFTFPSLIWKASNSTYLSFGQYWSHLICNGYDIVLLQMHDSLKIVIHITIVRISKTSEGGLVNLSFITLICAQTASNLICISFSAMFILNAHVDISLPKTLI